MEINVWQCNQELNVWIWMHEMAIMVGMYGIAIKELNELNECMELKTKV